MGAQRGPYPIKAILYLPYVWRDEEKEFVSIIDTMISLSLSTRVEFKLRMMNGRATATHAAYESAYTFCPSESMIVTSRHNVVFSRSTATEIMASRT